MSKVTGSGKNTPPEDLATASRTLEDFRFRMLIENSRDGITLLDQDLSIIYRSSSAERINGWSDAARGAKSLNDLVHPEDREKAKKTLADVLASPGLSQTTEYRTQHFDGHYIWLECSYTNMLNVPGMQAIVCNFRDITDRKMSEQKMLESAQFIKTITDNLPAMIAYWNVDLVCLFANKPYMDWF